jgi:hypothetical protein
MSPVKSLNEIPESTLRIFLALCDPFRTDIPGDISDDSWSQLSELARLHGVTPFLFYRSRQLGIPVPEKIKKEWLGIYLYSLAQDQKTRRQIKELKEILDPVGVPFILLKGASAITRLYPQAGLRTFVDLDIVIPDDMASRFKQTMTKDGYKPLSARNSPEDEELLKFDAHLDPLWKDGSLTVEAHLNILGIMGDHPVANHEIWQDKEETNSDAIRVSHLSKEQFIVHTLLHYSRHLSNEGLTEIKWLVDLLYAIRTWTIEWSKVKDISRKWGIEKKIMPVIATLNQYWQAGAPFINESKPIDLQVLVQGKQDREKEYYTNLPASYLERLMKLRKLPDKTSQVRYALHLFFPTRNNLRWRYNLSSKWSILPYYLVHLFLTSRKFIKGLWYQGLCHP